MCVTWLRYRFTFNLFINPSHSTAGWTSKNLYHITKNVSFCYNRDLRKHALLSPVSKSYQEEVKEWSFYIMSDRKKNSRRVAGSFKNHIILCANICCWYLPFGNGPSNQFLVSLAGRVVHIPRNLVLHCFITMRTIPIESKEPPFESHDSVIVPLSI